MSASFSQTDGPVYEHRPVTTRAARQAAPAREGSVYGSDLIVDLLVDMGVRILPFAPGATFRGLHDSLVNGRSDAPEVIECLHEEISVAIAHGYAKATGTLAAVAVHDIVGLQHAAMAIYNAWCDRVPLLVLGGSGPADAAKRRPWIDWIHTANVQATQVRDYTKWDDQPLSLEAVPESLARARQLATSVPRGPVYVAVDSEIQEAALAEGFRSRAMSDYPSTQALYPEPAAVERMARILIDSRWPVLAAESVGRQQAGVDLLIALAEELGCAVLEVQRDYNRPELCVPTRHPLNVTGMSIPEPPDTVLALEVRDLAVIPGVDEADVLQVSTAGLAPKPWAADLQRIQPASLLLAAEVPAVLEAVLHAVRAMMDDAVRQTAALRKERITAHTADAWADWERAARDDAALPNITSAYLAAQVDAATSDRDRVLANGSLDNWVHRLWTMTRADEYLGASGGGGLGYGLGASTGAALAHRETGRLVIDLQTDGDALMTPGALWTAARHSAPLLIVIVNNRMWGNSFHHARRIAASRGRAAGDAETGTVIADPAVDFVALAHSFGIASASRVEEPARLLSTLQDAVSVVEQRRQPAVVEVVVAA